MPSVLMGSYGLHLVFYVKICALLPAYAFGAQQGSLAGRALHCMKIPAQRRMASMLMGAYGLHFGVPGEKLCSVVSLQIMDSVHSRAQNDMMHDR